MSEKRSGQAEAGSDRRTPPGLEAGAGERGAREEFDREIDVRSILVSGAVLALIVLLALAGMWILAVSLKSRAIAADPPPSPLKEANEHRLPPAPRLQVAPPADMRKFLQEETAALDSYGWADRNAQIARIPIDLAIAIVAERGLPPAGPMPASGGPDAAAPGGGGTDDRATDGGATGRDTMGGGPGTQSGSAKPKAPPKIAPTGKQSGGPGRS